MNKRYAKPFSRKVRDGSRRDTQGRKIVRPAEECNGLQGRCVKDKGHGGPCDEGD